MDPSFLRQLRELIKKLLIELSPNNIFLEDILDQQRNQTLAIKATDAIQLIRELQDSLYKVEYSDSWPILRMLISFCYCNLNDIHSARLWAEDAAQILKSTNKEWNLAFAYWFLAVLYSQEGYFKDSREQYMKAQNTFQQIMNNAINNNGGYRLRRECRKRIRQISYRTTSISGERSRLMHSARNNEPKNVDAATNETSTERTGESNSGANVLFAPINVNIHVPIDNRSADHFDPRALQYTQLQQDQSANQKQESALGASVPLGIDSKDAANQPGFASASPLDNREPDADIETPWQGFDLGYLMTPSLPLYGTAGAGPDGQVVLHEPDYNAAIDESAFIRIEGEEYKIYSLRADNARIRILHTDFLTSIIPRQMRKTGRRAYGWLQVTGNSMNEGQPIKNKDKRIRIENDDYVLFFESNDLDASVGKIVIASESLPDSGPVRLLVKQLVKKNNQFYLRSYSRDKNPNTGEDFEDLPFDECYQLIGEVIAVAKPKTSEEI